MQAESSMLRRSEGGPRVLQHLTWMLGEAGNGFLGDFFIHRSKTQPE